MKCRHGWLLLALPGCVAFACQDDRPLSSLNSDAGASAGGAAQGQGNAAGAIHVPDGVGVTGQGEAGAPTGGGGGGGISLSGAGVGTEPGAGGGPGQDPGSAEAAGAGGQQTESLLTCHDGGPGEGATCASYCGAWFPICKELATTANVYTDTADCLAQCATFSAEQLCCRGYHVTNAPTRPSTHCTHAAGFRTCP